MSRYIDKEKVIERINYLCEVCSEPPMDRADEIRLNILRKLENDFNKLPTADVVEVVHSEWHTNTVRMNSVIATCRNCHRTEEIHRTNCFEYCPHCGAKMDVEE